MRESASSGDAFYLDIVHLTPRGADFAMKAIAPELGVTESGRYPVALARDRLS